MTMTTPKREMLGRLLRPPLRMPDDGRARRGWNRTLEALEAMGLVRNAGPGDPVWDYGHWSAARIQFGWTLTPEGYRVLTGRFSPMPWKLGPATDAQIKGGWWVRLDQPKPPNIGRVTWTLEGWRGWYLNPAGLEMAVRDESAEVLFDDERWAMESLIWARWVQSRRAAAAATGTERRCEMAETLWGRQRPGQRAMLVHDDPEPRGLDRSGPSMVLLHAGHPDHLVLPESVRAHGIEPGPRRVKVHLPAPCPLTDGAHPATLYGLWGEDRVVVYGCPSCGRWAVAHVDPDRPMPEPVDEGQEAPGPAPGDAGL